VAKVLERTLNPRVAPRRIFLRHPHDQVTDRADDSAAACSGPRIGPFAGDELPMPTEQRVRRDKCRHIAQRLSAHTVGAGGQPSPVVVGQPKPASAELSPKDTVLFNQIGERLPLSAIQPADDTEEQKAEDRDVDHERELISHDSVNASAHRRSYRGTIRARHDSLPRFAGAPSIFYNRRAYLAMHKVVIVTTAEVRHEASEPPTESRVCVQGNYGLKNILTGHRNEDEEKTAAPQR
jgi:hypothetical protein